MKTSVAIIVGMKTGKTDHLILILTASAIMVMLYRFLTMLVMLMFTSRVAMVVMNIVTRM